MNGKQDALDHLVRDVFSTREDDIQCEEAEAMMARCAHAHLPDEESRNQYPALWRHFRTCQDCAEEYRLAMALAQMEEDGQLEQPAAFPPQPDEGRPALWERAVDAVVAAFPGFAPVPATPLARGADLTVEPVEVELAEGQVQISLHVVVNERDAALRDLFCTVMVTDEALQAALDGTDAWLQIGDKGPVVLEKVLNELGDVTFARLPPGRYALRVTLAGQEYVVSDLVLP